MFKVLVVQVWGLEFGSPETTYMSDGHGYSSTIPAHGRWTQGLPGARLALAVSQALISTESLALNNQLESNQ